MQKGTREKPLRDVPRFIVPMRPKMVPSLPDDRFKWLLEPKLDGYRVIATKTGGKANLYSMDAKIYNAEFPDIYEAVTKMLSYETVLDGEIVAVEPSGRPNFNALQNRKSTKLPIYFIAFDCLHYRGRDLVEKPIEERKKYLAEVAQGFVAPIQPILVFDQEIDLETAITVVRQSRGTEVTVHDRGWHQARRVSRHTGIAESTAAGR